MKPTNERELAECIASSQAPLWVQGGGTRMTATPSGNVLSTTGLNGISLYEPGALTMVAGAGTRVAEVEAALAKEGQRLAHEPMDHRALLGTKGHPTLGGIFAGNVSGPRRIQVGAARDFLLGVRFVDGIGQTISNGGRVMKNVTGYDLVKLLAGSFGTLGVLSEVSLKVLAVPETEASLVFHGQAPEAAVKSLTAALGTAFDVTGAAYLDEKATKGEGRTQVRIEGFEDSVSYRAKKLQETALPGFEVVRGEDSSNMWQEVRDVVPFAGDESPVWRISLKPTDAPRLTKAIGDEGAEHAAIYDWGGGLIWLKLNGAAQADLVRSKTEALGGHATLMRGSPEELDAIPKFHPQRKALRTLEAGLRAKFDPRGILNPGLMG